MVASHRSTIFPHSSHTLGSRGGRAPLEVRHKTCAYSRRALSISRSGKLSPRWLSRAAWTLRLASRRAHAIGWPAVLAI